jgi:prolyl 4-hydroxylase
MIGLGQRLEAERLVWRDGFLSPPTCELILDELGFAFWQPSTVVSRGPGGELLCTRSTTRRSATTSQSWFTSELNRELSRIERRLGRMLGLDRSRLEDWQATRYGYRDRFEAHHDGGVFSGEEAGERVLSILICLSAPSEGGGTQFPRRKLVVAPVVGRLVVWRNLRDNGTMDASMLHASMPVRRGRKVILITWCRERAIPRP